MQLKTTVEDLDFEDLVDLLSLFNSGCGYWVSLVDWEDEYYEMEKTKLQKSVETPDDICVEEVWAMMLLHHCSLWVHDEEGEAWELNYPKLVKGLERFFGQRGVVSIDKMDAEDGDVIFQLAILGEVVYG